ncbi:hypothetical protein HF086_013387 [Spodoptera exigua]|uniref:Uncharacterized protein n=1 Tax=Spodoptera exigua TaxID=7107 RepID=A0A922MJA4_SPOEX|nr:hypothetical protein HF086_013387 [Spodoptera exigua]
MLEESRMEKKSLNRTSQPQSRASAIDCKKNTESTQKPWPRSNKKREGPGSAPKNEPSRKYAPAQHGRGQFDRRPRPRGSTGYHVGGAQNTRLGGDEEPEIGSVFVPGSKKQNLNHLLNFTYPSRGVPEHRGHQVRRPGFQYRGPNRYGHDHYLRAYCQFVVNEDGDIKANLLDPDIPLKWEHIEEVVSGQSYRSFKVSYMFGTSGGWACVSLWSHILLGLHSALCCNSRQATTSMSHVLNTIAR